MNYNNTCDFSFEWTSSDVVVTTKLDCDEIISRSCRCVLEVISVTDL